MTEQELKFMNNVLKFMEQTHDAIDNLRKAVLATNKRIDLIEMGVKNDR